MCMPPRQRNNLRAWREHAGLTIEQLAEKLSVSGASISRIESGIQQPRTKLLARIAKLFGKTEAAFYGGTSSELEPAHIGLRRVPVLDYIQAANWNDRKSSPANGEMRGSVLTDGDYSEAVFAMKVAGLSMHPRFEEGDVILVDPAVKPKPNDVAVFKNGAGETAIKVYKERGLDEHGRTIFEAVPANDGYPSWRSDVQKIEIIGTVVEHRKYLRR